MVWQKAIIITNLKIYISYTFAVEQLQNSITYYDVFFGTFFVLFFSNIHELWAEYNQKYSLIFTVFKTNV